MTSDRLRRIEQVFHEARERPDAERDAWLAATCTGDSSLHREVLSLLHHAGGAAWNAGAAELAAGLLARSSPLPDGTALGPYVIETFIGAGGMGDVYRARDSRLGRSVALKVLPPSFTRDPARLARFSREAQLLAALNHPHIAQIHGLEQAGDATFLVLELVEGHTLHTRIAAGSLPLAEALDIAAQIAGALEAAHDRGIVHRDLKPANVALTEDGQVKLLDFGLATSIEPAATSPDAVRTPASLSPLPLTGVGAVLGTAAYMAPEQAAGRRVDKRADVWAFGCVLYEMLTGTRAFPGADVQETLASVLAGTPDWQRLPAATPPAIHRLLRRCLEKDMSKRLRDIGDARLDIADALAGNDEAAGVAGQSSGARRWRMPVAAAIVVAVVAGVGAALLGRAWPARLAAAPPVQRFSITFSPAAGIHPAIRHFALSPDGARLAFVGLDGRLWLRSLDDAQEKALAGTEGAFNPFFSPDGEWVGYVDAGAWGGGDVSRRGKLKKVAVHGGVPLELADAAALGASWGRDGTIVFCDRTADGVALFTIPASGGTPRQLTTPPQGNAAFRVAFPSRLADDTTILFSETDGATFETGRTVALSLRTRERHVLLDQGYGARYIPSGHLVYALNGSVMAVPFDARRLTATGPAVPVLRSVTASKQLGWVGISVANGLLLYDAGLNPNTSQTLQWAARDSEPVPVVSEHGQFSFPRLSPDGRRLAVGDGYDIWIVDLNRGTRSRIAAKDRGNYPAPTITSWTADGRRLVMNQRNTTDTSLVLVDPDDASHPTVLLRRPYFVQVGSWSRDGALAFFQIPGQSARDVWVLDPGASEPRPFAATPFNERGATFSPDGRWIAYAADPTGRDEIYVRPYPGPGAAIPVSTGGGAEPAWARTGREILYRNGNQMLSVSFTAAPTPVLGPPQIVFERPFAASSLGVANYDVAPDGRFIMIAGDRTARPIELAAVVNWLEELKARAPVK